MKFKNVLLLVAATTFFSTANIANAVVGQNDINDARFITLPFDEVYDSTGLLPDAKQPSATEKWPADICEEQGGAYMHYKYKPTEDQMINILASGRDTEIRVINADDDSCLWGQDNDNLNYWEGQEVDGVFVPATDGDGNYIAAGDDEEYYVGEAPHWYQENYLSDWITCEHGCSENSEDNVELTANTTYIIQIAAYSPGRNEPDQEYDEEKDARGPTFVSIAVGGTGAARERPTPSPSIPVPTLPLFSFGILIGLLGLFGLRKLKQ